MLKGELEHKRSTVTTLKEILSTQSASHLTLTTQNTLLTEKITVLRSSLSTDATSISGLRGLHHLVMEPKGTL